MIAGVDKPQNTVGRYPGRILLWIALTGVVMLPRLLNLDTFIGPDEKILWGWGNHFALAVSQGDWHETLVGDGYPAVTLMWVNTMGVALKWLWLHIVGAGLSFVEVIGLGRPPELFAERRMFLSLFNGLQILAAYPLLRQVWDEYVAALSVGLMGIEPLFLAFARMIRADAVLAGFMLLSILATLAFLKTGDRRYNWLAGAMGGLGALSKLSGGVTALVAVALYAIVAWNRSRQEGRQSLRWLGRALLGWGVPSALIFFGLWPAWWVRPLDTFELLWGSAFYYTVEVTTTRSGAYFWGTYHPLGAGPAFYWVLAALRLSPWLLMGGLVFSGRWLWYLFRRRVGTVERFSLGVLLEFAIYWLVISFISLKTDRYFLPVISGLAVLTAIEMVRAARWAMRRLPPQLGMPLISGSVGLGLGLLMVAHVITYHPLYSTYFDPLISDSDFVQWALPLGNGEGVDTALKYLSTLPDAADRIVVCGTNYPRCNPFFSGKLWHQEDLRSARWFEADYALWHIDEQQTSVFPAGVLAYLRRQPRIYIARYHGVDYTWLYAIPQPGFLTGGSKLEGVATLLGYDVGEKPLPALSPGDQLRLHIYWQNEGQAAQQRFWWRIVDGEGYVWSEATAWPSPEFEVEASQPEAVVEGTVTLTLPPDIPPGVYYLKAGFANAEGDVGQFALPAEGSSLAISGPSVGGSEPANVFNDILTSELRLRGYDFKSVDNVELASPPIPGEALWLTLYWQGVGQIQRDYLVILHLLDGNGREVASWSGRPIHNTLPTRQWTANAKVRDPWRIWLPSDLLPGQYRLMLSLFDAADSTKLAQVDLETVNVLARRINFEAPTMQYQVGRSFGDIAALLGYDLSGDLLPNSARVRMTLYWQALRATDRPYTINVRLVNANGLVLAEQESQPAAGMVPTTDWQLGEIVTDLHEMEVAGKEPVSVDLELRLLDATGNSVLLQNGAEAWIVSNVRQKIMWRISGP